MNLTRLGIFTATLLLLTACSEQVRETVNTKANRDSIESGKPSAPIYLRADTSTKVTQLNVPVAINLRLQTPAGSTPKIQFTMDPGLEMLSPAEDQIQLPASDTGEHELSIEVRPTLTERLYIRVFIEADGKARSFSFPVMVAGVTAKSAAQRLAEPEEKGENVIVMPSQER